MQRQMSRTKKINLEKKTDIENNDNNDNNNNNNKNNNNNNNDVALGGESRMSLAPPPGIRHVPAGGRLSKVKRLTEAKDRKSQPLKRRKKKSTWLDYNYRTSELRDGVYH